MSSEELRVVPGPPVIPNGVYHIRFGASIAPGGMYLTAGRPGAQATASALRPQPGKTQTFTITHDARTGGYLLKTDPTHGLSYRSPAPGQQVITSVGAPREFTIVRVAIAAEDEEEAAPVPLYNIGVGGGPTRLLGIGLGPETITPPPLRLRYADRNTVWQLKRLIPHQQGGEEEEEEVYSDEDA